jgi:hypothetical protein
MRDELNIKIIKAKNEAMFKVMIPHRSISMNNMREFYT